MLSNLIYIIVTRYFIIFLIVNNVGKVHLNKSVNNDLESKIVGGKPVPVESFPSTVKFYNFGSLCSGTILNSWSVLTAAHCFTNNEEVNDMTIEVGARYSYDTKGDLYDVISFVVHEDYNKEIPFACDVGLVFVSRPIKFGSKSKKALIVNSNKWMKPSEKNIVVAGWGWTEYGGPISESGLMSTQLRFVESQECERLHHLRLTPDMFCLYGGGVRDTCKGDSGGGVYWRQMLIGVVSHGDGCAKKNKPSVYANVWYLRNWIRKQIEFFIENACEINLSL